MGIDASIDVNIYFVDDREDKAIKLFRQIVANPLLVEHCYKVSYCKELVNKNNGYTSFSQISLYSDDRNYWFENFGLSLIRHNVTTFEALDAIAKDECKSEGFCKHFNCVLEMKTFTIPYCETRTIWSPDDEVWLSEEDEFEFNKDNESEFVGKNPEYDKISTLDLIMEKLNLPQPSKIEDANDDDDDIPF